MVVDTSALVAILLDEPEAIAMVRVLAGAETRLVGAPPLVETAAVMHAKKGSGGEVAFDALFERLEIGTVPMSLAAARLARLGGAAIRPY